jgi:hypothetical protein
MRHTLFCSIILATFSALAASSALPAPAQLQRCISSPCLKPAENCKRGADADACYSPPAQCRVCCVCVQTHYLLLSGGMLTKGNPRTDNATPWIASTTLFAHCRPEWTSEIIWKDLTYFEGR